MSPITHFLTGWVFANCARLDRRERALVTLASVAPDVDGLGIVPEFFTRNSTHPLLWFSLYHHSLHTLTFAAVAVFPGAPKPIRDPYPRNFKNCAGPPSNPGNT
jgi:inner membrane protein